VCERKSNIFRPSKLALLSILYSGVSWGLSRGVFSSPLPRPFAYCGGERRIDLAEFSVNTSRFAVLIPLWNPDSTFLYFGDCAFSLTDNRQSFVDKNSYQPAVESSFGFKRGWIPRDRDLADLHHIMHLLRTAEYTASKEEKHLTTSGEPGLEYRGLPIH
jgi:hypothetical protein